MAKPGKNSPAPAAPSKTGALWPAFVLVAATSALAGAFGMRLYLQPRIDAAIAPVSPTQPVVSARPVVPEPPADLTAGQTPAQAERTLGNYFYDHADWPRALQHYAAAIRGGSDDADIRTDYANAYQFNGRFPEAVEQYLAAQKLDPTHQASRFNLAVCYAEGLKDSAKAIATWEEFLRLFPNSDRAAAAREGITHLREHNHSPAAAPAPAPAPTASPTPSPAPAADNADVQRMMQHLQSQPPAKK